MIKTVNPKFKTAKHGRAPRQAGFTLLMAALVASISLALGAAIFGIAQKQLTLSAIGRDSQFAFYAADTIAECALYWDFRYGYFGTSTSLDFQPRFQSGITDPKCDGQSLEIQMANPPTDYTYTLTSQQINLFQDVAPPDSFCAEVSVTKSLVSNTVQTVIHANGYSTKCALILTSARALQRSVELHY